MVRFENFKKNKVIGSVHGIISHPTDNSPIHACSRQSPIPAVSGVASCTFANRQQLSLDMH